MKMKILSLVLTLFFTFSLTATEPEMLFYQNCNEGASLYILQSDINRLSNEIARDPTNVLLHYERFTQIEALIREHTPYLSDQEIFDAFVQDVRAPLIDLYVEDAEYVKDLFADHPDYILSIDIAIYALQKNTLKLQEIYKDYFTPLDTVKELFPFGGIHFEAVSIHETEDTIYVYYSDDELPGHGFFSLAMPKKPEREKELIADLLIELMYPSPLIQAQILYDGQKLLNYILGQNKLSSVGIQALFPQNEEEIQEETLFATIDEHLALFPEDARAIHGLTMIVSSDYIENACDEAKNHFYASKILYALPLYEKFSETSLQTAFAKLFELKDSTPDKVYFAAAIGHAVFEQGDNAFHYLTKCAKAKLQDERYDDLEEVEDNIYDNIEDLKNEKLQKLLFLCLEKVIKQLESDG